MSADLHIHVFEGVTEDDLSVLFSSTLGSKWFNPFSHIDGDKRIEVYRRLKETPNIWVGEVSWLKAALFDDEETYAPDTLSEIVDIIGEDLPTIDDSLIARIKEAFALDNRSQYVIASEKDVCRFLEQHKGKRVFTVTW